jgi:lysophospholipase L1-like esterase
MNRLARVLAAAAVLVGVAAPAQAVDYGSGAAGGPTGTPVKSLPDYTTRSDWMIFGDSITVAGYKQLAAEKPGWRLAVNAQSGRGTVDAVNQALAAPFLPPRVVMAVGSNDVFDPTVMAGQIRRLREALEPRGIQVYWVTVHVVRTRGTAQLADQRNSGWVNAQIQAGCTAPCKVIDWASFLAANPYYRIPNYLRDGVHPSTLGVPAWAALISGGVK